MAQKSKFWKELVKEAWKALKKAGNPFKALIEAIADLKEEVSELNERLSKIEKKK